MKLGIGALAVGNRAGLGRLARGLLLALAAACPEWELHVCLRNRQAVQMLADECDHASLPLLERLIPHFPNGPLSSRLWLEEYEQPRQMAGLGLDAWLGLDFTLPAKAVARREFAILPDLLPFTRPATLSWRARLLYRNAIRRGLRRQAAFICISRLTEQKLIKIFPQSQRAGVVYPPLSPRFANAAAIVESHDTPLQILGSLNSLSGLNSFLLAVGAGGSRKNTGLLVDIHREIVLQGDYRGSLVLTGGDGSYHSAPVRSDFAMQAVGSLMDQGSRAAAVYDLGRVTDLELALLYSRADMLVSLSSEEGFGYPVLEALACGTPALVTAGSSMLEIAEAGIVATELERENCRRRLLTSLAALPELRAAVRNFDIQAFSLASRGRELRSIIEERM